MLGLARRHFLALTVCVATSAAAADGFVAGIEDLPLMPSLRSMAGSGTVFDAPSGRIVEVWAEGLTDREAVLTFYGAALPQLGWTALSPGVFRREGEALRVEFPATGPGGAQAAGRLYVRFYLSPS